MADDLHRLDGWKEIAAYLGRDERTAQRWRQRGLPVHAVPGGKRGTVFAYSHELDHWLVRDETADQEPDDVGPGDGESVPAALGAAPPASPQAGSSPREVASTGWRGATGRLIALALMASAVGAYGWGLARRPADVANGLGRAEVSPAGLTAWTASGSLAFSIPSVDLRPPELRDSPAILQVDSGNKRPLVVDLDGDGRREVLIGLVTRDGGSLATSEEIRCYDAAGRLRWSFQPRSLYSFGGRRFDGPWLATDWTVVPEADGSATAWVTITHDVWWPSQVISLDAAGTARVRMVNSGHLYRLLYVPSSDGDLVLATGVNNEHRSAVVIGIDPRAEASRSPQSDRLYTCDECTAHAPAHYVLLPQSELGRLTRPYNLGAMIGRSNGEIRVSTQEMTEPVQYRHFIFGPRLELRSAYFSDGYWALHARLERSGQLDHAADACPDRAMPLVQAWRDAGWQPAATP